MSIIRPAFALNCEGELVPLGDYRQGHIQRLTKHINCIIAEYRAERGNTVVSDLDAFIQEQVSIIVEQMYASDEIYPDYINPETEDEDYYVESIAEYSTPALDAFQLNDDEEDEDEE